MSWASRRRAMYAGGIVLMLAVLAFIPIYKFLSRPATCADGVRNQGETTVDKGGPCPILDENALSPITVLWARAFEVRQGLYSAVAYIENPNSAAGAKRADYHMRLYDGGNILIAERSGSTFIMPGTITPIFESGFDTGQRDVVRTYVELAPGIIWEKTENPAKILRVSNKKLSEQEGMPRLEANVENTSTRAVSDIDFVSILFSPAGNARAASKTRLPRIEPGSQQQLIFTWPEPFPTEIGRVDILPLAAPIPAR